jgi:hypothetical protein
MATTDKVFQGAMAVIYVDSKPVGLFDSASYNVNHGAEPIFTVGRHSPHEIAITSQEAVSVNCSGFRIIGQGAHVLPKAPKLQDLISLENITLMIKNRVDGNPIMTVKGCKVVGHSGGVSAKQISRVNINYLGTAYEDESGAQEEAPGAATLP